MKRAALILAALAAILTSSAEPVRTATESFVTNKIAELAPLYSITTNDVCNIVTNEVIEYTEWTNGNVWKMDDDGLHGSLTNFGVAYIDGVWNMKISGSYSYEGSPKVEFNDEFVQCDNFDPDALEVAFTWDGVYLPATRTKVAYNSLGLARASDIPSTAADIGALPITGGTLMSGKVGKGSELSISGSGGTDEQGEFIPEGGFVEIRGGDSDEGGSIGIYGGYGNGGHLTIYPPNGLLGNDYGIDIKPYGGVVGGGGFIKVNGTNVMDAIAAVDSKVENAVLPTNPSFSNAVLSVGLNIDTNSVAVLNEIAQTFGGFPIEGTATTVGGLLAALAAAIAWLKKNKVGSFASVGGASATVENGVAKLNDFFTESNSLLNVRLTYSRNATGLKDRAFNTLLFDGTEFNLSTALEAVTPTASGQPRDLLIVATATAATTIGYTAGTIKGDKLTIDGPGTWLITLTEYASGVWYCRQIKMEDAA